MSAIASNVLSFENVMCVSDSDSQPDSDSEKENVHVPQANQRTGKTKSTHPQFGRKQPKNHPPPPCLNPKCKVEREARKKEIEDLKHKLENLQEELSKQLQKLQCPSE